MAYAAISIINVNKYKIYKAVKYDLWKSLLYGKLSLNMELKPAGAV